MEPEAVQESASKGKVYWREGLPLLQRWQQYCGVLNMPKAALGALVTDQGWFRAKVYS